jgi:amidohydrolase
MSQTLINLRRETHQHPELSGHEKNTANRIIRELKKCSPDAILEGVGGTGIIARFNSKSGSAGKTILFRAELDAIAVQEQTGLSYSSKNSEVMHACGHDGHMTILTGLAQHLKNEPPHNCNVLLMFQPAEETGQGAGKVLADSQFQSLKIDRAYALHNLPGFSENAVFAKSGPFAFASVGIDIEFKGSSSHAAYPEQGINPAGDLVEFLKNVEQAGKKFSSGSELGKMTVTYIKMGEPAFGISPGTAKLGITIRASTDEKLDEGVKEIQYYLKQSKSGFRGKIKSSKTEPFSATINDETGVEIVRRATGKNDIEFKELSKVFPWSEDFGAFREKCPITLVGLGAGEDSHPLHSEKYDFNNNLIPVGIKLFRGIIREEQDL